MAKNSGNNGEPPKEFTLLEIQQEVSNVTNLPPDKPEVARYAGVLKEMLKKRDNQRDLQSIVRGNLPPELLAMTDPNVREKMRLLELPGTSSITGPFNPYNQLNHLYVAVSESKASSERDGSISSRELSEAFSKDPLSAEGAIAFTKVLGINPAMASFFVGSSKEIRVALRDAIKDGKAIEDDKVTNMKDVSAVVGAVRAGKLSPDDPRLPPSVKHVLEDMKKDGIDPATADPNKMKKYLHDHPDALKAAKRAAKKSISADATLNTAQKDDKNKNVQKKGILAAARPEAAAKEKTLSLDL